MIRTVDNLRNYYNDLRTKAYNNDVKNFSVRDIKKRKQEANRELERMQVANDFEHYEETNFLKEKFTSLEQTLERATKQKISMGEATNQVKEILKERNFEQTKNTYLNRNVVDAKLESEPMVRSKVLQSFFEEKKSKVVPDVGFRSLLENPPVSTSTFKKRKNYNNEQIDKLKKQIEHLKMQLAKSGSPNNYNLTGQIRRQEQRIRYLQQQNSKLAEDNDRLRSQKSMSVTSSYRAPTYADYMYSPYIIEPRENNLLKITSRTSESDTLSYQRSQVGDYPGPGYRNYTMADESPSFNDRSGARFERRKYSEAGHINDYGNVFDMDQSRYSEYLDGEQRKSIGSSDMAKAVLRNKRAFFRREGVLIKKNDFEVGYKRSQPNHDTIRIILYFKNNTGYSKKISLNHKSQQDYYSVRVTERASEMPAFKQCRQVVEVTLSNRAPDLNSIIETELIIDGAKYQIWLPAMFVQFSKPINYQSAGLLFPNKKKTVYSSMLFANEKQTLKTMPQLDVLDEGVGMVLARSPLGSGLVNLDWMGNGKVEISTSGYWVDLIAFLIFEYK